MDGRWCGWLVGGPVPFVGRERELSRVHAALAGDSRLLLIVGDAGVGKTRLVEEGVRRACADGLVAVWGCCLPLAATLPLLPVAEALGELSKLEDGRLLATALDAAPPYVRAEVDRLLPQLWPAAAGTTVSGEGWARARLFSAVAELLGA